METDNSPVTYVVELIEANDQITALNKSVQELTDEKTSKIKSKSLLIFLVHLLSSLFNLNSKLFNVLLNRIKLRHEQNIFK